MENWWRGFPPAVEWNRLDISKRLIVFLPQWRLRALISPQPQTTWRARSLWRWSVNVAWGWRWELERPGGIPWPSGRRQPPSRRWFLYSVPLSQSVSLLLRISFLVQNRIKTTITILYSACIYQTCTRHVWVDYVYSSLRNARGVWSRTRFFCCVFSQKKWTRRIGIWPGVLCGWGVLVGCPTLKRRLVHTFRVLFSLYLLCMPTHLTNTFTHRCGSFAPGALQWKLMPYFLTMEQTAFFFIKSRLSRWFSGLIEKMLACLAEW